MATPISEFRPFIRTVIGDENEDAIYVHDDYQIDCAVKLVVGTGRVPGYGISGETVTPSVTMDGNWDDYAKVIYHAAKLFTVGKSGSSFSTRGYSQRSGADSDLIANVLAEVGRLDAGERCR